MSLEEILNGTLADPEIVNNNFNYLDERITDTVSKIYTNNSNFESKLSNVQNYLNSQINSNITTINNRIDTVIANIETVDKKVDNIVNNPYPKPDMDALIDWENMAFKANVADVRNINNTTTGIKAYGGDHSLLRNGDIYLKEEFTKYQRIMVVWTDDRGSYYNSTVLETWLLDYLLNQSKGITSLINSQYANYYWGVWGYNYSITQSNVTYKTNKKFFLCNGQQNCGIVEIYGLKE